MQEFINYLKEYISVTEEIEKSIVKVAVIKQINKGEILLKQGGICKLSSY